MTRATLLTTCGVLLSACGASGTPERVPVPPGSTVRTAAESLSAHGIIHSTAWFRLRARLAGVDRQVKSGVYEFHPGQPEGDILTALSTGAALRYRLTVPPGGTLFDLAHAAESTLAIPAHDLLAAAADTALLHQFHIAAPTAEGWLRPETFDFGGFDRPRDVLVRFLNARRETWDSTWDARAAAAHLDRNALLTLASIVEAETGDSSDRPIIAAVYRNRLRIGMPLQADPTIEYGYLVRDGVRKGELHDKDYQVESPWNTYLHPGLPPGPINNPSRSAIEAVLSPAHVPYLYFVAGADGKHVFSTTYDEHLAAIARVRRAAAHRSTQAQPK
ncbi:MAG TPA: endolytic transglycosylase MltG [Gemmatimonadales bacterium]|jgi:UPF0755 protein|nr:endolytic transglycosylase MltG [Gemmatimonadales bacterium]